MAGSASRQIAIDLVPDHLAGGTLQWLTNEQVAVAEPEAGGVKGLFVAQQDGDRRGAIWANVLPGKLAALVGPRITESADDSLAARLIDRANYFLEDRQIRVAQAVVPDHDSRKMQWYEAAGYADCLQLDFLVRSLDKIAVEAGGTSSDLVADPSGADDTRMLCVLEATYEGSQDCPVLNGRRELTDVLATYRALGRPERKNWLLLTHDRVDVGCLLLTGDESGDQAEIVYLGIVPDYRGRGFGAEATRLAQTNSKKLGFRRLSVAVDRDNVAAQSMYARAGFIRWDQQQVLLRFFD